MKCPGCNGTNWERLDAAISRCQNCGYLVNPNVYSNGKETTDPYAGIFVVVGVMVACFMMYCLLGGH